VGLLGIAPFAQAQEEVVVTGTVQDAAGRPVSGAEVAGHWTSGELSGFPMGTMRPALAARTEGDGRFSLKVRLLKRSRAFLALDAARQQGGLVVVAPEAARQPVTIRLAPLVSVRGRFACKELGSKPLTTTASLAVLPEKLPLLGCGSKTGEFAFQLPPGTYQLTTRGVDILPTTRELVLSADQPRVDLGTIDLEPTIITRHLGKTPPPWHVTDARGIRKDVQLADLRGKWVVLEFWGFG
jgi:hypothetical protein